MDDESFCLVKFLYNKINETKMSGTSTIESHAVIPYDPNIPFHHHIVQYREIQREHFNNTRSNIARHVEFRDESGARIQSGTVYSALKDYMAKERIDAVMSDLKAAFPRLPNSPFTLPAAEILDRITYLYLNDLVWDLVEAPEPVHNLKLVGRQD